MAWLGILVAQLEKFFIGRASISEKVIPLIVQDAFKNSLDLFYLKYAIEAQVSKQYFGFNNKVGKGKIQDIEIAIPINKSVNIDLKKQKELAKKFMNLTKYQI